MYQEILGIFSELKELLKLKREAIIHKKTEELSKIDEEIIVLNEKIEKIKPETLLETLTEEQKAELKKLGSEIKTEEENNEILMKYSINVINNILSGILNIAVKDKSSYNSEGKSYTHDETLNISSITEEA